jgi:hypothetical protein
MTVQKMIVLAQEMTVIAASYNKTNAILTKVLL